MSSVQMKKVKVEELEEDEEEVVEESGSIEPVMGERRAFALSTQSTTNISSSQHPNSNESQSQSQGASPEPPKVYHIGPMGGKYLSNALSTAEKPFVVIAKFQQENGLAHQKANEMVLPLLDLLGLSRKEVYASMIQHLRQKLIDKIRNLPKDTLEILLEKTFPFVGFEELREIPMMILTRLPHIRSSYLKQLATIPNLYEHCPIEVKRQIWQISDSMFREKEILPLILAYVQGASSLSAKQQKPAASSSGSGLAPNFSFFPKTQSHQYNMMWDANMPPPPPSKRRKENEPLQLLLHCIGTSQKLYNSVCHFVKKIFVNLDQKNEPAMKGAFCALRSDLIMGLHDKGISDIYDFDPSHKFAWCLDASVRDNEFDPRRISELQLYFDSIFEGSAVLGDLSMIIANPFSTNSLIRNIFSYLQDLVQNEQYPKDHPDLIYLAHLLQFGGNAEEMLKSKNFLLPEYNTQLIDEMLPLLAFLIAEDALRANPSSTGIEWDVPSDLDPNFEKFFLNNYVMKKLTCQYLLTRIREGDYQRVSQLFEIIKAHFEDCQLLQDRSFIQSLVSELIRNKEASFRSLFVDSLLLKFKHDSLFVYHQLARYITECHSRFTITELLGYISKWMLPPEVFEDCTQEGRMPEIAVEIVQSCNELINKTASRVTYDNCPTLFALAGRPQPSPPAAAQFLHENAPSNSQRPPSVPPLAPPTSRDFFGAPDPNPPLSAHRTPYGLEASYSPLKKN